MWISPSRNRLIALGLACFASFAALAHADVDRTPRIIRPPDDRADYFATTAMLQAIGDSVAAQMGTDALTENADGSFTIVDGTLADQYDPMCNGERFGDQPNAASCTATLVGPDVLITAGHCLDENGTRVDLNTIYFVFDYAVKQNGVYPSTFTADQVYRGIEILGLANVESTANDWAVVRLDRTVTGRTPVGVRSTGAIAPGQAIVAIGFGAGLPMKFSDNATVQVLVDFGFEADLDIIEGNSGGPIINAETGLIEAVLSADQAIDDYFQDGDCFRATVCPEDPDCDNGFTLLASVMTLEFQDTIRTAIGGGGGNGDPADPNDPNNNGGTEGDEDLDGVPDEEDFCPDTPEGTEVDLDGCGPDDLLDEGDDGGSGAPTGCGVFGLIPIIFLTLSLMLMRRRN